jgi:hypothetical protein
MVTVWLAADDELVVGLGTAGAHISMRGTRGSTRVAIFDIRGWKEAESRPRSWR